MSRHNSTTALALGAGLILAAFTAPAMAATAAAAPAAKPAAAAAPAAKPAAPKAKAVSCNRTCLEGFVDRYLAAMVAKDIHGVPWTDHVRFTENGVPLLIGDGLWGSMTARGPAAYDLKLADPANGEVGYYGVVMERDVPGFIALRMKVIDGRIDQVETIVNRQPPARGGGPRPASTSGSDPLTATHFPEYSEPLKASERVSRAAMVKAADGYFATLQRNNGKLFTSFTPDCQRKENGFMSTAGGDQSCGGQFKLGKYRYDSAVRRNIVLVDEERGVAMGRMFIDHDGSIIDYKLTDGTPATSTYHSPQTLMGMEIFKIKGGKIDRAEVVFLEVPYNMPSVWDQAKSK